MARSYLRPQATSDGRGVELYNCLTNSIERDRHTRHIHDLFRAQVLGPAFPCALGKGAFSRLTYRFGVYDDMTAPDAGRDLCHDLWDFVVEQPSIGINPDDYSTFIVVYKNPPSQGEVHFETMLWALLRAVHQEDSQTHPWDPNTSSNPDDPQFSFSVRRKSFFIVGMHSPSSRISRKFPYPAFACNSHDQFEHLRQTNKFNFFQQTIRRNDVAIQGDINPSLTNYGADSEAKQYSGRLVPPNWKCPFP